MDLCFKSHFPFLGVKTIDLMPIHIYIIILYNYTELTLHFKQPIWENQANCKNDFFRVFRFLLVAIATATIFSYNNYSSENCQFPGYNIIHESGKVLF